MMDPAALPAIIFAVVYYELGEHGITWEECVDKWTEHWRPALKAEHFGDCINQPTVCFRCQAEDVMRLAGIIEKGILHEHDWIDIRNGVVKEGTVCKECGAIR